MLQKQQVFFPTPTLLGITWLSKLITAWNIWWAHHAEYRPKHNSSTFMHRTHGTLTWKIRTGAQSCMYPFWKTAATTYSYSSRALILPCFLKSGSTSTQLILWVYSSNICIDMRVNDLPPPDNHDNNADSCKHQYNHRHSNTCHQDSVTRWLRLIQTRGTCKCCALTKTKMHCNNECFWLFWLHRYIGS